MPIQMVVTNAGIAAADAAQLGGFKVVIDEFRLGDATSYTPSPNQTAIMGTQRHTGSITNIASASNNSVEYILTVPRTEGTWMFNEIGLYSTSNIPNNNTKTLFAIGVLSAKQQKIATSSTVPGNTIEIRCIIQLNNIAPTISFSSISFSGIPRLSSYDQVPSLPTSESDIYIINENNENNHPAIAFRSPGEKWAFTNYPNRIVSGSVGSSPAALSTQISSTSIGNKILNGVAGRYLIQFTNGTLQGLVRELITTTAENLARWTQPLASAPATGTTFEIYTWQHDFNNLINIDGNQVVDHSDVRLIGAGHVRIADNATNTPLNDLTASRRIYLDFRSESPQAPSFSANDDNVLLVHDRSNNDYLPLGRTVTIKNIIDIAMPIGSIILYVLQGSSVPSGFLRCNGSLILRADYPELFNLIGTRHGSSASDNFRLPNLQSGSSSLPAIPTNESGYGAFGWVIKAKGD